MLSRHSQFWANFNNNELYEDNATCLVLALLQISHHLYDHESETIQRPSRRPHTAGELCEVLPLDVVIRFEKDLTQARLSDWVVFEVELVEPMEGVLMRVHIQGVDRKIVRFQVQRLEDLRERKMLPITEDHNVLRTVSRSHTESVLPLYTHSEIASSST